VYKAELFSNSQAGMERGEQAIFIIGLPRRGSRLVERIITSHSDVESAGELKHFPNLLTRFIQESQQQRPALRK
jgi:sulfotransferase family protein